MRNFYEMRIQKGKEKTRLEITSYLRLNYKIIKLADNYRCPKRVQHPSVWNIDETGEIQRFNRSRQPPFPTVPSILSRSLERRTRDELSISGSDVSASRIRSGTNGYRLTQIDKRQGCAFHGGKDSCICNGWWIYGGELERGRGCDSI